MRYLLDTCVISELRKAGDGKAAPAVTAWLNTVDAASFHISVVTVYELELGILQLLRKDRLQADRLRTWMDTFVLHEFGSRTLVADSTVALRCAQLHVPDPQPQNDSWIAATALVHGMTVVTRNTVDFLPMDVPVLNPWQPIH